MIEDQVFHLKNVYCSKFRTFYCCVVVIYCFEEFGKVTLKRGPRFNTFLKIFYKKIEIFVLSYNILHFVPIFKEIDKKFARYKESFVFM